MVEVVVGGTVVVVGGTVVVVVGGTVVVVVVVMAVVLVVFGSVFAGELEHPASRTASAMVAMTAGLMAR